MARLQILELPTIYGKDGVDETPFVLVIDRVDPNWIGAERLAEDLPRLREQTGARSVLVIEGESIEIPANDVPVGPDGYPVRLQIEGDFTKFREQVMTEIAQAQADMRAAVR